MSLTIGVVLAGGKGRRFGGETAKQFVRLSGIPTVNYAVTEFLKSPMIDEVLVVLPDGTVEEQSNYGFPGSVKICFGGKERFDSSYNALKYIDEKYNGECDKVLFHDGCRPFLTSEIIEESVTCLQTEDAIDVAINSADTVIYSEDGQYITNIPKRSQYFRGQTPQGFQFDLIYDAFNKAKLDDNKEFTDDCGIFMHYHPDKKIKIVAGNERNMKITHPMDAYIAERLIQQPVYLKGKGAEGYSFEGKNIMILGGSRGIGAEVSKICSERGGKVSNFSRATGYDVGKIEDVRRMLEEWKAQDAKFDIAFLTAGVLYMDNLEDNSDDKILELVNVNLTNQILLLKGLTKHIIQPGGSIVLFTSSSYTRGRPKTAVYSAAKAGMANFTQGYAEELIDKGIRLNCICPPRTNTEMRTRNFPGEDPNTLMAASVVADLTVNVALSNMTGQIIDVTQSIAAK